jgi:hypothetical protein
VLAEARPGSIIVAHANGRGLRTAEALPLFVPQLRAKGFEFVTVGELLAAGEPEVAPTCYERRPGDNTRYDVARLKRVPQPASAQAASPQRSATPQQPRPAATSPAAAAGPAARTAPRPSAPPPAWPVHLD